jgi:hypothetical protein
MRRVLREMRFLAAELARRGMRDRTDALLEMADQLPRVTQPDTITTFRAHLLAWQLAPNLQDDLSSVLSQLRAIEHSLEG